MDQESIGRFFFKEVIMREIINKYLDMGFISSVRRNHGLEHAILQILARKYPQRPMAGYSDPGGIRIVGDISTEELSGAAEDALQRLRNGEHHLAVHPNCGTNFVVGGILAGIAGAMAMIGVGPRWRDKIDRLGVSAILGTTVLILSQPLAYYFQAKITTSGEPGALHIVSIRTTSYEGFNIHRIITRG
jgi:hypothetical protein